jgi:Tetratricopeptide repeat
MSAGTEAVQELRASGGAESRALAEALVFTARLQAQSVPGQAVPLLEEAEQLLTLEGVGQPAERVAVLSLLAEAYEALDQDDKAQEAAGKIIRPSREVLVDEMRALGIDHPDTLITQGKIAFWTGKSGDFKGAVHLFNQLLSDRLRVLGPDHPATLLTRG